MSTAVTPSPGMPKVIIVVMAPPMTALLAQEVTAKPLTAPLPNSSGCLEKFLVCCQQMMAAISPPVPGTAPMTAEMAPHTRVGITLALVSLAVGKASAVLLTIWAFFRASLSAGELLLIW